MKCLVQLFAPEQGLVIKSCLRRDYSRVPEPSSAFCTLQWKRGCSGLNVCSAADPPDYWVPSSQRATEANLPPPKYCEAATFTFRAPCCWHERGKGIPAHLAVLSHVES